MYSEERRDSPGRRPWSLATRLTIWYSVSAFALIAASTAFLYWALITNLDREDDQLLADKIELFGAVLRDHGVSRELTREIEQESMAHEHGRLYVRILAPDRHIAGETKGMSQELPPELFPNPANSGRPSGTPEEIEISGGRSFRIHSALTPAGTAVNRFLIQIAMDRTYEEKLLAAYRRYLWLGLGLALALSALVGRQIARAGLRPIADITQTALHIRASNLRERIATLGLPSELYELSIRFNEMLDRLQASFERISQFSADIAHELRTPVNNLGGEIEVALGKARSPDEYRDVLSSSLEECARLSRLIDTLLFLARAEHPQTQIQKESLDIGGQLRLIKEFYEPAAVDAGISLVVCAEPGLVAQFERALFQRAVGNLVDNALTHTKAGGSIRLEAAVNGPELRVTVSDTGAGIAAKHLPHVFDRFYRADRARQSDGNSAGLGLAIVKGIVTLHGGTVSIVSEVGQGTQVIMAFPRCLAAEVNPSTEIARPHC
jgi:two-component system heavy metal sensor histidine kinase CusS